MDKSLRDKDGCRMWLKRTKTFLETLAVVIHITYGQPARAEELASVLIKNQTFGMRNIYWSRGRVMLATSYSKTRSTTGKEELVAGFLPKEVGDLLVKYLSLIRPTEAFLAERIGCKAYENYEVVLFTDDEKIWSGQWLSGTFKRQMNQWGPAALGFREYRQLITVFMRKHMNERDYNKRRDGDDVRDIQAGHRSHTAVMRYGVGADDMTGVSSDRLWAFFRASQEWHHLLRFK